MLQRDFDLIGEEFLKKINKNIILGKENYVLIGVTILDCKFASLEFDCCGVVMKYTINDKDRYIREIDLGFFNDFNSKSLKNEILVGIIEKYLFENDLGFVPEYYNNYFYKKYCCCVIHKDYNTPDKFAPYSLQIDRSTGEIVVAETNLYL